jgi:hypothetical protein
MPEEGVDLTKKSELLTNEEVLRLVSLKAARSRILSLVRLLLVDSPLSNVP